jgi:hypothetical protein
MKWMIGICCSCRATSLASDTLGNSKGAMPHHLDVRGPVMVVFVKALSRWISRGEENSHKIELSVGRRNTFSPAIKIKSFTRGTVIYNWGSSLS